MDTFDIVNFGVFFLILLLVVSRMTFWKRQGQLLSFQTVRTGWNGLALYAVCSLSWFVEHHHGSHWRIYYSILMGTGLVISFCRLAVMIRENSKLD